MEIISIPSIVVICYFVAEMFKLIIKDEINKSKLISLLVGLFGGVLGLIAFFIDPKIICNTKSPFTAIAIGMVSGFASINGNNLIRKIGKKKGIDD